MTKIQEDIDSMKIRLLEGLLSPLSLLYWGITTIRNWGYERGYKKSYQFKIPLISVGNLSVGGTGKTPTIEYLIQLLQNTYQVAVLSRGYGRKTRGILFAKPGYDDATQLGDESYQMYRKYSPNINVIVGENRVFAIRAILSKFSKTSVILLDDAYQHRRVDPQFSILLTDFEHPFYDAYLMPMGRLREARKEAKRAHVVVVTKCPSPLLNKEKRAIKKRIIQYSGEKPIFFSCIEYGKPQPFWHSGSFNTKKLVLLSGIAKPNLFEKYLKARFDVLKHFVYPDHYAYTTSNLRHVQKYIANCGDSVALMTTEKDMAKLIDPKFNSFFSNLLCYYMPIKMLFTEHGNEFDELIMEVIQRKQP